MKQAKKFTKKFASLLLGIVMVLSLSTAASAAGAEPAVPTERGTITIDNAVVGQTYTVYRIFDLESYDADTNAYSYKVNSDWAGFFTEPEEGGEVTNGLKYVTINEQGYVTWREDVGEEEAAALARDAKKYAGEFQINPSKEPVLATGTEIIFDDLDLGYYLVDSTLGVLCSLDTTNPAVVIREKNDEPTIDKTVEEDSTGDYGDVDDADIGQTVNFRTVIHAKKGAQNYVVHDKMTMGLTLNEDSIEVAGARKGIDYTVAFGTDTGDECTFEITFVQDYLDQIVEDMDITITYSAVLNDQAVIADAGNLNETRLEYGDDNFTEWDTTVTYTWKLGVLKYGDGDETNVLDGASFVLLNNAKTKVAIIADGKVTGWADVPSAGEDGEIQWPENTIQTTDSNGEIHILGLDADIYYLREVEAPKGYNKLSGDVEVEITPNSNEEGTTLTLIPVTAKVNNQSGSELPSTGGMGTRIFYVIGSILILSAAVLLITRKRMDSRK